MKPCVFIHTNHRQYIGALVSAYSMQRCSPNAEQVRRQAHRAQGLSVLRAARGAGILARRRQAPLAQRRPAVVHALRFMPPELMGYAGAGGGGRPRRVRGRRRLRAADARHGRQGDHVPHPQRHHAAQCRQLCQLGDAARLREARASGRSSSSSRSCSPSSATIASGSTCEYEPDGTIGEFEPEWNDFDRLSPATKMVHNTKRNDPALEERPAGRLHPGRDLPAVPADRLADARAAQAVRRLRPAPQLSQPPGRQAGEPVLRPAARMRRQGASSARSCCARRCAATTSATTRSR